MESGTEPGQQWNGRRVYVMGLGRFGGGIGVTRYLAESGAEVVVGDTADESVLAESIASIQDLIDQGRVRCVLGAHAVGDLDGVDTLVVNPAVPMPWSNTFVLKAESRGVRITTEIEIAIRRLDPNKVIAVTGSAGKSTTSAMIDFGLTTLGFHSVLSGNIGGSLLGRLGEITPDTTVVLELSSAMLYWLDRSGYFESSTFSIGCITNCIPNHLDWHGDETHYIESKQVLLHACSHLALGETLVDWGSSSSQILTQSDAVAGCFLPGHHNAMNAGMAACVLAHQLPNGKHEITQSLREFQGLPHRLQFVGTHQGIGYFNDSKCTVPNATLLAVDALKTDRPSESIHLIVGGYDKGSDLSALSALAPSIGGLYTIGSTGQSIYDAAATNAYHCGDLLNAMNQIRDRASHGDTVLLSPGCASWDQFSNYEARGDRFMELAKQPAGELL